VKAPDRASWRDAVKAYLIDAGIVVATGFLLLVSLVATTALTALTESSRRWFHGPPGLWFVVDFACGLAMATAVFALVFRVIPDATVRWRDAWVGGAFTAALFTVGRLVLGVYLGREKNASVFDAAGSVVALLVWVYYSAQLVLFGAEFTFVYATRKQPRSMHT
jgi:membrane protein